MKYRIILFASLLFSLNLVGQTNTILIESFDGLSFPPTEWTLIDYDEDGKNWYQRTDSETDNKLACSKSYESGALTPYNIIISENIDLTGFEPTDILKLSYKIGATGNNYYQEHYKLVVSQTGNSFNDFSSGTILLEETLTQNESGWNLKTRIIDISDYADQPFWLAWIHYNCTDQDGLLLDDIHLYEGDDPIEQPYTSWIVGDPEDAITENFSLGVVLAGGGGDNNDAMTWFANKADGGDIVVLRASGSDGYNSYFYSDLGLAVNSVETLLINSIEAAEDPYVEQQIRNAEALFIAGGDQYDYYEFWKDTPVMDAINYLINDKKVVVGGTSAGMAILGKVYYTPSGSSATAELVLANPFHSSINIIGRDDFIDVPILENTITDTHFDNRDRSGRLFTFLSRMVNDWDIEAKGIAANEYTAVCIDADGKAYVFGNPNYTDYAYFLKSQECAPEVCQSGQPLTWDCNQKAVKVFRIQGKESNPDYFDLNSWDNGSNGDWFYWYAENGTMNIDEITSSTAPLINNFKIYPNPSKDEIWINSEKFNNATFNIFTLTGQIIKSGIINNSLYKLDVSSISTGLYILKITSTEGIFSERIMITE